MKASERWAPIISHRNTLRRAGSWTSRVSSGKAATSSHRGAGELSVDLDHRQFSPLFQAQEKRPTSRWAPSPRFLPLLQGGEAKAAKQAAARGAGGSDCWSGGARRVPSPPGAVSPFPSLPFQNLPELVGAAAGLLRRWRSRLI